MFLGNNEAFENKVSRAESKMAGFIAECNLPITITDHIEPLLKDIATDSDIVKYYSWAGTKTTCILNWAIEADLQKNFFDQMKESWFSICTGEQRSKSGVNESGYSYNIRY